MTNKTLLKLIRPDVLSLAAYPVSITQKEWAKKLKLPKSKIIKLNSAENSSTQKFFNKKTNLSFYAYPDPYCLELRKQIAQMTNFSKDWIACGNGSDEIIDLLIALFVNNDQEIILSPPTFPMYEFCAKVRGVKIKKINRLNNLQIDPATIIASITKKTKLIFLDSPGNPTGQLIKKNQLVKLLEKNIIVVVDEAYFEFSKQTVAPLIKKYPNLIVLRSFSKWAGLAGLRLGYLIANPEIIKKFLLIKPPYNVNSLAQKMGLVAIKKRKVLLNNINRILKIKKFVVKKLKKLPLIKIIPGSGAYILVSFLKKNRSKIVQKLQANGVLVKIISQTPLENSILVSVDKIFKMKTFINSFRKELKNDKNL